MNHPYAGTRYDTNNETSGRTGGGTPFVPFHLIRDFGNCVSSKLTRGRICGVALKVYAVILNPKVINHYIYSRTDFERSFLFLSLCYPPPSSSHRFSLFFCICVCVLVCIIRILTVNMTTTTVLLRISGKLMGIS